MVHDASGESPVLRRLRHAGRLAYFDRARGRGNAQAARPRARLGRLRRRLAGRIAFSKLDVLHRRNLELTLKRFGVTDLDEADKRALNLAWHRLDAWPDVLAGLARLKTKYLLAPVSNGNISLMVDLARRNRFLWDAILGAEIARDYKPNPRVYLASAEAFDLTPDACMMVAAHSNDLAAAAALGLRTAHVARPTEHGPGRGEAAPSVPVDFAVKSLEELAAKL